MIYLLILWTLFCITHAREHTHYVIHDHSPAVLNRLAIGFMTTALFIPTQVNNPLLTPWIILIVPMLLASVFWLVFDVAHNVFSGEAVFYIGNTAQIDRWGRKHSMVYWCLKMFTVLSSIVIYLQCFRYGFSYAR